MDSVNEQVTPLKKTFKRLKDMTAAEMREYCAWYLEKGGWSRELAAQDWDRGVDAFTTCARIIEPRRRGILVTGPYGCGKTAFINAAVHRSRTPTTTLRLSNRAAVEMLDYDSPDFDRREFDEMFSRDIILDDLGAECMISSYGIKRDTVGEFITEFHYRSNRRLFITTNLTAAEIVNRYGGRVADRLKELCIPLTFTGDSKRKWAQHGEAR